MDELSEEDWDRLRIAWKSLHPGSWPERGRMLADAIAALEREADERERAKQSK